jgi:Short C-terminal domain/Phospholipase_D-nuclease N-terminal
MQYPLLDAFLTMLWFFLWMLWIFLVVWIIIDIFGRRSLSGWGKASWLAFVILLPFLGVFCYLIAHGSDLGDRRYRGTRAQHDVSRVYPRDAAGSDSVGELTKLADLRDRGVITDEEFEQGKAKILA